MKKLLIFFLFLLPLISEAQPQQDQLANLHLALKNAANDTIRMDVYHQLASYYNEINSDSAFFYLEQSLPIAQNLKLKLVEAHLLENQGYMSTKIGNYPKALESFLLALKIAEDPLSEKIVWNLSEGQTPRYERLKILGFIHLTMGHLYGKTSNPEKRISNYLQSKNIAESNQYPLLNVLVNMNLGFAYLNLNKLDTAFLYAQRALSIISKPEYNGGTYDGGVLRLNGSIYQRKGDFDLAIDAFQKAQMLAREQNNLSGLGSGYISISNFYRAIDKPDSSLLYAYQGLQTLKTVGHIGGMANAYQSLSSAYDKLNKRDSALTYLKLATSISDSLNDVERKNLIAYQNLSFDEQIRLRKLEEEKIQTQTKIRTYAMLSSIAVFMLIAFLLYRNNKNKHKANVLLKEQKDKIQTTLEKLESTQSQLIQSEKMASLGELTAGIAHEIQNPLNFVNNFSEVNSELIEELRDEVKNGDLKEVDAIAKDIAENEQKISHHGKRASSIVKGMLEHSRKSTGEKVPTDINGMVDEYLRLAYHGLRAKDGTFQCDFKMELDQKLPLLDVIPQDIGRVLLNLINNGFQACAEKAKDTKVGYHPELMVTTKTYDDKIEISIKDNGGGIPDEIKDKIFHPFFTTKPTGSGTGLGLSLSYDIVKAHSGHLKVESKEGVGTTFNIELSQTTQL